MDSNYDLAIIGAGPAALSAAVYAGRYGMKSVLIEQKVTGGQMATADRVDNYMGFPDGISGLELANHMHQQATRFGAEVKIGTVTGLENIGNDVKVHIDTGDIVAKTALIATGSSYRHIGIDGEDKFAHYCATCDGAFYKNKNIITIGGANSAVQEALYLSTIARHVTMLVRSYVKADQILRDKLNVEIANGKISLLEGWRPLAMVEQDGSFVGVRATNEMNEQLIAGDGVFVFAGQTPSSDFLHNTDVQLDDNHYVLTDRELHTSMANVWAAGDVRSGTAKQIVSATADGAQAVINIHKHFREA